MAKSVTIDGKAIEVADNVAALLTDGKLGEALSSAHKAVTDAIANMNKAEARADVAEKAVADLKAENTDLKGKVTTDAALADKIGKAAAELAIVLDAAKALAPDLDTKGKTADEIKRGVVGKHLGDDKVKDKSADYIAATFDLLTSKIADADPFADLIKSGGGKTSTADAAKAAREYEERQSKAWQH